MAIQLEISTFIFGLIASVFLFVVAILFGDFSGVLGCFIFLGIAFTLYAIFAFLIPSMKNSRDFVFSYGVSAACMFVAGMMTFIIMSHYHTRPHCRSGTKHCAQYLFGSIFGFVSTAFFLVASILSFKIVNIW